VGTYHVVEASRRAGVGCVILASSTQVSPGYQDGAVPDAVRGGYEDVRGTILPVRTATQRPPNVYAASKVGCEAVAHVYAQQVGVSCLCVHMP
jgi:uronate dehydrogenase